VAADSALDQAARFLDRDAANDASGDEQPTKRPSNQATDLVDLAVNGGVDLFHDPTQEPYALVTVNDHREVWRVKAKPFRDWLARTYFAHHHRAPGGQAVQDALGVLAGMATYDGDERPVFVRIAEMDGAIFLDLGDASWQAVKITAAGWELVAQPPVMFRRPKALGPLPIPTRGGSIAALRPFVNLATDADFVLLVAWLVGALRPAGPFANLALAGEQGSAKSTTARIVRSLVDPSTADLQGEPANVRDLAITAANSWVIGLDNLSRLPEWLSDALCRLLTGGALRVRELYANDEETIFTFKRPSIVTAITDVVTRPDLLDRTITVDLPRIPPHKRQPEAILWHDFRRAQPEIIGALLDAASQALANLDTTPATDLPRLADFAQWITAASSAFGWEPSRFRTAYDGNRAAATELALDALPIATAIRDFMETRDTYTDTATALLAALAVITPEETRKERDWPRKAQTLSNHLKRIAPNLRDVGITVDRVRTGPKRLITLHKNDAASERHDRHNRHDTHDTSPEPPSQDRHGASSERHAAAHSEPSHMPNSDAGDADDDQIPLFSDSGVCAGCGEPLPPGAEPYCLECRQARLDRWTA
jgi:hypothetical protein